MSLPLGGLARSQPLRRASEGVIPVYDVGRTLHLLPTADLSFAPFTRCRTYIVVKGERVCTGSLLHDFGTLPVVRLHDLMLVEKINRSA